MTISVAHIRQTLPALVALAVALIYLGVVIANNIERAHSLTAPSTQTAAPSQMQLGNAANELNNVDINQLPAMHLFGQYSPAPEKEVVVEQAQPEIDLSALPKTKINLKLSGIGYTNNNERAYAIIVTPNGQHDHFVIGEEIVPGASVHLIEKGRVIITREGNLEVLELPDTSGGNPNLRNRNTQIARTNNRPANKTSRN